MPAPMGNVLLTTSDGRRFLIAQLMDSLGGGLSSVVLPWLVLVAGGHFVEGQSALSFVWSMGLLIGPALGGALIGLVGAHNALWVQAAGFAVAIALLSSMRVDLGPGAESRDSSDGLAAGLRMVVRHPMLRLLTAVGMAWNPAVNLFYW